MTTTLAKPIDHEECLVIRDLTVAYGRKVVLKDVQADIRRGQVVGVIGPNGGGKSTLLKAILGMAPVITGSVALFGKPINSVRSKIAYVPQRELVDWEFPVTAFDVVAMGRYPHSRWFGRTTATDRKIVSQALERVDMLEHRGTQIGQLSGGQQQRVFIARALAQEADVLLLDEPMNGIDAGTQEIIMQVIEEQRVAGKIVLLATHDLVSASCACDCLCCVNERMVSYGPLNETYTVDNLAETYGGPVIMLGKSEALTPGHSHSEHAHHAHDHQHHADEGGGSRN